MQDKYHELAVPSRVVFQAGAAARTGEESAKVGLTRPFVVTDRVVRGLGFLARLEESFAAAGGSVAGVFDAVPQDGDLRTVHAAAEAMAATDADGIVAVGGGSVMDSAKAVNILRTMGGELVDHQGVGVLDEAPFLPFVCLPTTAGTGSEVTMVAAIKDAEQHQKLFFVSTSLAADVAILDPELTVSMPAKVTAATGMDALTHAIESILAVNAQPATDGLAVAAIRSILKFLPRSVRDGADLEARGEMLLAANIAGIAFSNSGVGVVHACAHALGALRGVPHGLANSLMLPHGVRFNHERARDRRELLEWSCGSDDIAGRLAAFAAEVGLPGRLREAGVREEDLDALAGYAESDPALLFNPREAAKEDLLVLYREAF